MNEKKINYSHKPTQTKETSWLVEGRVEVPRWGLG
jgi:hypothetical protein